MTPSPHERLQDLEKAIDRLGIHDHLCLIYRNREEQFAAVIPFMRIGLERGEKCLYIADDNTATAVIDAMRTAGLDVETAISSGSLVVASKQETYVREGFFNPDHTIAFLKQAVDEARAEGFSALRITGEMTWVLGGDPGAERLMEYEAKLNYFFPDNHALAICQYNFTRFSPEVIMDVLHTHPLAICGGRVCKNFYYVPPDEFLKKDSAAHSVERLLQNIVERAGAEEKIRKHAAALAQKNAELEEMLKGFVNRETKMMELKRRIKQLEEKLAATGSK